MSSYGVTGVDVNDVVDVKDSLNDEDIVAHDGIGKVPTNYYSLFN